ncbi:glycoside hydrolase family 16 protein [Actinocorallia sp. B10E7]|uniref:glycoside hydrolase family 16 protein n=1 Tax=Actinocorallia sp. B10E7 TaxID=3153558 RepID=UPI00325DCAFD
MKRLGYGLAAALLLIPVGSHLATGSTGAAPPASAPNAPEADPEPRAAAVRAHPTGPSRAPVGWGPPALAEDFEGDRIDLSRWAVYHEPEGAHPRTRKAVSVGDGVLRLTGALYGGRNLSGGVAAHYAQTFGRFEARMRVERGAGYSAVILLWPTRQGDPEWAEINFAEIPDSLRRTTGLFVHHGKDDKTSSRSVDRDFTRWHVFAVEWLPDRVTFFIDGKIVWEHTGDDIPKKADMHLALQNDVVCYAKDQCRDETTPERVTMYVDWVRVYPLSP